MILFSMLAAVWKMDGWMIQLQAPSSGKTLEFSRHNPHSAFWVLLAVECTSVVQSLLWVIMRLSALNNVHYGFRDHKWLSSQIVSIVLYLKG